MADQIQLLITFKNGEKRVHRAPSLETVLECIAMCSTSGQIQIIPFLDGAVCWTEIMDVSLLSESILKTIARADGGELVEQVCDAIAISRK